VRTAGGEAGLAALAGALRREVRRLDPAQPVADLRTMAARSGEALGRPRMSAVITGAVAAAALALALVGLYGVIAFAVARRTREIGVRIALGARPADVLRMVAAEGLAPALAGVAAGLPLAAAAARALSGLLFGIAPLDPATFAGAALLLAASAAVACALPARRAARVDPVVALSGE
jgi:putative ABC transport system permease protein